MKNQSKSGTPTSRRFVLLPTTVLAGQPLLVGTQPCVALDNYQANLGGATCLFNGSFYLTVVGSTSHSPYTPAAVKPGDALFASGTLDTATNVTTGLLISKTSTDTPFGSLDPDYSAGVGSGLTDTAAEVKING